MVKIKGILIGVVILLVVLVGVVLLSSTINEPNRINVSPAQGYFLGAADAPITIVEFSDFECPFCGKFYEQTLKPIKEKYVNTGKVRFVYRNFPLINIHDNSLLAAQAAEAAGEQGKYWEMHDLLYENQDALELSSLLEYAQQLDLDIAKFSADIESGKYLEKIQQDMADAKSYGISGTPTSFINGIKVVGAQPYSIFEKIIEEELARVK